MEEIHFNGNDSEIILETKQYGGYYIDKLFPKFALPELNIPFVF